MQMPAHFALEKACKQSPLPTFPLNTQPHVHTVAMDSHIQSHRHHPEMWCRSPALEPHSIVSQSSQRTNRSFHRDVITCRLMSSYSQNKWSITSPITGRPAGKWQQGQRRLVPLCHCRRLSRKVRWGAHLSQRAFLSSLDPAVGGGEIEDSLTFGRLLKPWIPRTKEKEEEWGRGKGRGEEAEGRGRDKCCLFFAVLEWRPASSTPGQWSTTESHPTKD